MHSTSRMSTESFVKGVVIVRMGSDTPSTELPTVQRRNEENEWHSHIGTAQRHAEFTKFELRRHLAAWQKGFNIKLPHYWILYKAKCLLWLTKIRTRMFSASFSLSWEWLDLDRWRAPNPWTSSLLVASYLWFFWSATWGPGVPTCKQTPIFRIDDVLQTMTSLLSLLTQSETITLGWLSWYILPNRLYSTRCIEFRTRMWIQVLSSRNLLFGL